MNTLLRDTHPPHIAPGCDSEVTFLGLEGYTLSCSPRPALPEVSAEITRVAELRLEQLRSGLPPSVDLELLDTLYMVSPFSFVLRRGHRLPRSHQVAKELDSLWRRVEATPPELYPVELHSRHFFFASLGLTAAQAVQRPRDASSALPIAGSNCECPTCREFLSENDPLDWYLYELGCNPHEEDEIPCLSPEIWCPTCGDAFAPRHP